MPLFLPYKWVYLYTQVLEFLHKKEECVIDGEIDVLPLASHGDHWLLYHVMVVVTCLLLAKILLIRSVIGTQNDDYFT